MKTILITGAAGGMGRATVSLFQKQGWRVFALDRVAIEEKENITPIVADLTDEESVKAAVEAVAKMTDKLDAIIHFAGIYMLDSLVEMSTEAYDRIFDINVRGVYLVNKHFCHIACHVLSVYRLTGFQATFYIHEITFYIITSFFSNINSQVAPCNKIVPICLFSPFSIAIAITFCCSQCH